MNKEYYNKLLLKLQDTFKDCCIKSEHERAIILSKREIEDLGVLWKDEAIKKWGIKEEDASLEKDGGKRK